MINVNGDCETVKKYYILSSNCRDLPPFDFLFISLGSFILATKVATIAVKYTLLRDAY